MLERFIFSQDRKNYQLISKRIIIVAGLILFVFFMLSVKIFYLQVFNHQHFTTLSENNHQKILPITPIRGLIFSRNDELLAGNKTYVTLELIPEKVIDYKRTIKELSQILGLNNTDIAHFESLWEGRKNNFTGLPIKHQLTEQEISRFAVNNHRFPGISMKNYLVRDYPEGVNFAHSIGYMGKLSEEDIAMLKDKSNYTGTSHIGKTGLEKTYEHILHGQTGYQQVEVNSKGRIIRVLEKLPSTKGTNLYLTLDLSLQKLAMDALQGRRGAIVALDPENGELLTLASSPSFDPNWFIRGITNDEYQILLDKKNTPLLNRAIQGLYPPGSTIKPIIALAALTTNIRKHDDALWCPGWYKLPGHTHQYRDWKKEGHGQTDIRDAIIKSCDTFFYKLANDLGITPIYQQLEKFGFGESTGIELEGEAVGLIPSNKWSRKTRGRSLFAGEIIILGIGQGAILTTPIQLAQATAIIANRGRYVKPHLVRAIGQKQNKNIIATEQKTKQTESNNKDLHYDNKHWQTIIEGMTAVVHDPKGTAYQTGKGANYLFAGKTGTVQVFSLNREDEYIQDDIPENLRDHALFIAFAPIKDPKIAVAIIIENGGSGSSTAAPIARQIFDQYLLTKNVKQK